GPVDRAGGQAVDLLDLLLGLRELRLEGGVDALEQALDLGELGEDEALPHTLGARLLGLLVVALLRLRMLLGGAHRALFLVGRSPAGVGCPKVLRIHATAGPAQPSDGPRGGQGCYAAHAAIGVGEVPYLPSHTRAR